MKNCETVQKSRSFLDLHLMMELRMRERFFQGVHAFYEPEELVGKTLLAIVNLPPRSMMGIDSCGNSSFCNPQCKMEKEKLNLVMLDDAIPAGAKLY